jgi:predicted lipid-binding transport protein (Tim44 family)
MPEKLQTMRRPSFLLAAAAAAALALAPALADARPGGGGSAGSRGSRTYSAPPSTSTAPGTARPFERSMTEPGRQATPYGQQAQRPPLGQPNPAGGFFSRNPLMAGLMGGLLGAGLFGLLSGHGLFGGFSGFASILGLLLQIGLIVLLVRFALNFFRNRQQRPAMAGVPNAMARDAGGPNPGAYGRGGGGAGPAAGGGSNISLQKADFDTFETLLKEVNAAWSRGDLGSLQRIATPEMVQYFADDLADLASRGLRNETRDLVLEKGDLAEAWHEANRDYATVAMRFSLVDVTRRLSDGAVVEGDPSRRTDAVELWTFVRSGSGGSWLLSAIQQTA